MRPLQACQFAYRTLRYELVQHGRSINSCLLNNFVFFQFSWTSIYFDSAVELWQAGMIQSIYILYTMIDKKVQIACICVAEGACLVVGTWRSKLPAISAKVTYLVIIPLVIERIDVQAEIAFVFISLPHVLLLSVL